ncbi:hypothetical protein AO716_04070 [Arthrobacter sp. Edens01]|nr:hypothetical protein AO716_04070 [Arthrobacter sp. Edens01]
MVECSEQGPAVLVVTAGEVVVQLDGKIGALPVKGDLLLLGFSLYGIEPLQISCKRPEVRACSPWR